MEVFADGWNGAALHAFVLKAQHHDDIAAGEALGQIVERLDSEPLDVRGQQGRWRDDAHTRTHRGQEEDIRARDPAVQDVAADGDRKVVQPPFASADRQRVEQRLGWVLVRTVPRIDDGRSEEHTSELQSLMRISYAVFCLKKKEQHHNSSQCLMIRTTKSHTKQ